MALPCPYQFQSTPPSREATGCGSTTSPRLRCFNPRPPHGRRRVLASAARSGGGFNPRPPHGRRRAASLVLSSDQPSFNPRPPHGRRPQPHRDLATVCLFQSTPPSREATCFGQRGPLRRWFQSTPPSREATKRAPAGTRALKVSIHAPLTGGDLQCQYLLLHSRVSIHAPPHGRRQRARRVGCGE